MREVMETVLINQHGPPYRHRSSVPRRSGSSSLAKKQSNKHLNRPLIHPIRSMQGAFEESLAEAAMQCTPLRIDAELTALERRQKLLELHGVDNAYSSRWRQKPGARYHPLQKIIAQISFGIHLLHKSQATSETEVIMTLQRHVDDIDSFCEDSDQDLSLARRDIEERGRHLLLPLQHSRTFNRMLCDQKFRTAIIEGNLIIEGVMQRTSRTMDLALQDIEKGLGGTEDFSHYLTQIGSEWTKSREGMPEVYNTMVGNCEAWRRCLNDLNEKAKDLHLALERLQCIVDEVQKRAGIASRRKTPTGVAYRKSQHFAPLQASVSTPNLHHYKILNKPLPLDPIKKARLSQPTSLTPSSAVNRHTTRNAHSVPPLSEGLSISPPSTGPCTPQKHSPVSPPGAENPSLQGDSSTHPRASYLNSYSGRSPPAGRASAGTSPGGKSLVDFMSPSRSSYWLEQSSPFVGDTGYPDSIHSPNSPKSFQRISPNPSLNPTSSIGEPCTPPIVPRPLLAPNTESPPSATFSRINPPLLDMIQEELRPVAEEESSDKVDFSPRPFNTPALNPASPAPAVKFEENVYNAPVDHACERMVLKEPIQEAPISSSTHDDEHDPLTGSLQVPQPASYETEKFIVVDDKDTFESLVALNSPLNGLKIAGLHSRGPSSASLTALPRLNTATESLGSSVSLVTLPKKPDVPVQLDTRNGSKLPPRHRTSFAPVKNFLSLLRQPRRFVGEGQDMAETSCAMVA